MHASMQMENLLPLGYVVKVYTEALNVLADYLSISISQYYFGTLVGADVVCWVLGVIDFGIGRSCKRLDIPAEIEI